VIAVGDRMKQRFAVRLDVLDDLDGGNWLDALMQSHVPLE
jgi:hypothetical protein